jgi:ATP-dependent transcriptional regulator
MINETSNPGLLKTKYTKPGLNKYWVPRQDLSYRLDYSLNHKVTLITAPAGYGKTTAVLKWLEPLTLPSAWLSLDAEDNDAIVFWRYICAALDNILSSISKDEEYVFSSQELLKAKVHLSILIDNLTNIPSDILLILDDFHFINNQTVLDDLSYFITYLPANLHLILISRTAPQLKLAKLGLKENLLRIRAKDLRFTSVEIYQYYQARGYLLQEEEIRKIESYTEGWAAALVAVTLSFKDEKYWHHVISSLENSNLHIETYLEEDVFHRWTQEQQDFMVKTSVLDRLCGPLCEAITDYDGSRLLKELYDENCYLVALVDEGRWFRYHHLFMDFLRTKLEKMDTALIQNLHRRAGEWLNTNGLVNEAIEHFLHGAHYQDALLLIEKHGGALVRRGEYAKILSWIERLPVKFSGNSPIIMLLKATYFTNNNDLQSAWKCMEFIELTIKDGLALPEDFRTEYMMVKTNLFLIQGDIENALAAISKAAGCGINQVRNTNFFDINLFDISLYRVPYHIFIKMQKGSSTNYDSFVKHYRSLIRTNPGYAPLVVGEFYYESGRLDEALPKLLASVDEAIHAHCPGALVPAMVTLAKIRRAHGDIAGALEIIQECENRVEKFHKPHWGYMLKAFKMRLYIDLNDNEKLDKWMMERRLSLYQNIIRTREYELIVLARVLIAKKHYGDAHLLLNRLLNFTEGLKRSHSIVEIANLLAITALKNLNEALAEKYFEKALSIGIDEGYIRSFVDELDPMVLLLEQYIQRHNEENRLAAFAQELLNLTKDAVKHSTFLVGPNTFEKLLTPTELKVFNCIIKTYDNHEISAELGITIRTVKAHTGSIYRKLGVKNRLQCLRKVRNTD